MIVKQLKIENFRGVKSAELMLPGHTLFVGPNNVGKSTILEALDLLLGPERVGRSDAINEHDFYMGEYRPDAEGKPREIKIEAVLTELSEQSQRLFRGHLEWWNQEKQELLSGGDLSPEATDRHQPALRVFFHGWYDSEEDEFKADTYFCHPLAAEGDKPDVFRRTDKRECGFLYLRSLRTGSRAFSLERGSLLDIILKLHEVRTGGLWEKILEEVRKLGPALAKDEALTRVLQGIEERVRKFIPLPTDARASDLHVTKLTRQDFREAAAFFLRTAPSSASVPFQMSGSGTVNVLVLALLTFIADVKKEGVIFAMEEPEIAIPPYTQRRIVKGLRDKATQCIITSHSPYVAESFVPDNMLVLQRENENLIGTLLQVGSVMKEKALQRAFRTRFAEGLLSRAVLVVEGESERVAFPAASEVFAGADSQRDHLDILGVTIIETGGDGGLEQIGKFFGNVGIRTYAFFDKSNDSTLAQRMNNAFDHAVENPCKGIEKLLASQLPAANLHSFITRAKTWSNYPSSIKSLGANPSEEDVRAYVFEVLKARKGDGYAAHLLGQCQASELPTVIGDLLIKIQGDLGHAKAEKPSAAGT